MLRIFTSPVIAGRTISIAAVLLMAGMLRSAPAAEQDPAKDKAFQPSLGFRLDFNSNIYDTSSDEIESWIGIVEPVIAFSTAPAQQRVALLYQGEYGYYSEDSDDNYADHLLSGAAQFDFGSRSKADFVAAIERGHFDRGSDQTDGFGPESPLFPPDPDTFDRSGWAGTYAYGAQGNRGRLKFGVGGSHIDYTNNVERTRFYDYATLYGSAGLSLLFHQRTAVVFDVVFTDIRYDTTRMDEASRDSEDWRYLVGLTWEATARTAGAVRWGIQRRSFEDPTLPDTSNPTWEVDVRWSPREHTHFDLVTSRINQESFANGAYINSTAYTVGWTHQWNRRGWESTIRWGQIDFEFVDSARNQTSRELYLGLLYPQGRLLTWSAGYSWRTRDSNLDRLVYDGHMFSIGLNIGT